MQTSGTSLIYIFKYLLIVAIPSHEKLIGIILSVCQGLSRLNQADTDIISVFSTYVSTYVYRHKVINNLLAYYELSDRLVVIGLDSSRFEIACFLFLSPWSPINIILLLR